MGQRNNRLDNYVYIYLDQRKPGCWVFDWEGEKKSFDFQPFYVGRGLDGRIGVHLSVYHLKNDDFKTHTINSIINDTGELPIHYRIFDNLTYNGSRDIEKAIIAHFGRAGIDENGILTNRAKSDLPTNFKKRGYIPSTRDRFLPQSKRIDQLDLEGNFIKKWDSFSSIQRGLDLPYKNIRNIKLCCEGKKLNFLGFIWEYDGTSPYVAAKPLSPRKKPVFQYDGHGNFLNEYDSATEAQLAGQGSKEAIWKCIRGFTESSNGFRWFSTFQGPKIEEYHFGKKGLFKAVGRFDLNMNLIESFKAVKDAKKAYGPGVKLALRNPETKHRKFFWRYI